jgi:hypothetical protein
MNFPNVELSPGDSIFKADEKVEEAFEAAGSQLVAFDGLNSFFDVASSCHFFQVPGPGQHGVVVVMTAPWEERALIPILNVLLELRLDPDPPGSFVPVRFYSVHAVPAVLTSVFGSSVCCRFECRALLVARFGESFQAESCTHFAALGSFLLRDFFGLRVGFYSADGIEKIQDVVASRFATDTECLEPINSLLVLGGLVGELVRSRIALPTAWVKSKTDERWPSIHVPNTALPSFPAIAHTIQAFQSDEPGYLPRVVAEYLRSDEFRLGNSLAAHGERGASLSEQPPNI